jgi:CheY-like chemotaxis protein
MTSKPLKILIVEDDMWRAREIAMILPEGFLPVIVKSAGAALGMLERDRGYVYAGLCIDHDLQRQAMTGADHSMDGNTVVDAVRRYISNDVPVLVHSMNPGRAPAMVQKLESSGFWVTRLPMAELNEQNFGNWLEEVKEIWEDFHEEE